jgi:hypothetical protein
MGVIVTYDDNFANPYSEIKLASGEHILLTLEKRGLTIKLLPQPGVAEQTVFECGVGEVAEICDGLLDMSAKKTTPLRVLVSVATRFPDDAALAAAFRKAAR